MSSYTESIFGVEAPQFGYDVGGENEEIIPLDFINVLKDAPETDNVRSKSSFNGHRKKRIRGKHWIFEVEMNLMKYPDPRAKYEQIKYYEINGLPVALWRRRDGEAMKDSSGNIVLFDIEVTELTVEADSFYDRLLILFESCDYVETSTGVTATIQANEIIIEGGVTT